MDWIAPELTLRLLAGSRPLARAVVSRNSRLEALTYISEWRMRADCGQSAMPRSHASCACARASSADLELSQGRRPETGSSPARPLEAATGQFCQGLEDALGLFQIIRDLKSSALHRVAMASRQWRRQAGLPKPPNNSAPTDLRFHLL